MQPVHGVVQPLVVGAHPIHYIHLPPQLPGVGAAGELFQLGDQLHGLALGQEGRRLHHVDEQLQLRQLEFPVAQKIAVALAADGLDVHAVQTQQLQIVVQALALGGDAAALQIRDHVLQGPGVALVRFLLQILRQIQQLQLFVGHGKPSLHVIPVHHCSRYGGERKPLFGCVRLYITDLLGYNKVSYCQVREEVRRCK